MVRIQVIFGKTQKQIHDYLLQAGPGDFFLNSLSIPLQLSYATQFRKKIGHMMVMMMMMMLQHLLLLPIMMLTNSNF